MKIYVASSWRNEEQPEVVRLLREWGHEVYDFRHPNLGRGRPDGFRWDEIDPDWQSWTPEQYRAALDHPVAVDGFEADKAGMDWADACVLVTPCGRSAHSEAAYMAGEGKPSFVLLRPGEPELMYRLFTALFVDVEELVDELQSREWGES